MIEPSPIRGKVRISFEDWDADMMVLASRLHVKPDPPDMTVERNHELAIDRLAKLPGGKEAIDVLYELVDDLPYRIDAEELLKIARRVIQANHELEQLVVKRDRMARQERRRKKTPPKKRVIRFDLPTNGKIGFTRGN